MADLNVFMRIRGIFDRSVGDAVERTNERLKKLHKTESDIDAVRERRSRKRAQLFDSVALGAAVLGPIAAATKAAVEFESTMADVRKVVDFDTPEQFDAMSQDVLKLSERMPVAASGIGDIVAAAGQAGIAREELIRFAEDAAKVAVAFDISGEQAGSRMTGLRSIFKLGQDDVMALAGTYNHLSNNMDATAPAMLDVAERTGAIASDFGLTGEQVGALAATFLELKTPPEVAGTAINAMLTKLANAPEQPKKFQEALDDLGISAEELKDDIGRDAQGALLSFLETVDASEDKQAILFNLFGQEYVDDVTRLAGSLDSYREALGLASDKTAAATSIQQEYDARAATTENQMVLLRNKTNALGVNIGTVLLPTVNNVVGGLGNLISKGAELAQKYPEVTRVVVGVVGGLVALRLGAAVAGYGATFVSEGWLLARRAMIQTGLTVGRLRARLSGLSLRSIPTAIGSLRLLRLALLGTGIGAAVVALGVGAALIMRYWEPIKAFFDGFGTGFAAAFEPLEPVLGWLGDILGWVWEKFSALAEPINATNEDLEGFRSTGESVGNFIGNAFRLALLPVTTLVKGVGTALEWLGVLDDTEVEAGVRSLEEPASGPGLRPTPHARGRARAAATAAAASVIGATAAAPVAEPPPAFPATTATATAPVAAAPAVDVGAVRAQVRDELAATEGLSVTDEAGAAAFDRIDDELAALQRGDTGAVPQEPGGALLGPGAGASLVFYQTFHFGSAGPESEEELARRMEAIMRRASVEAGLAESDDVY